MFKSLSPNAALEASGVGTVYVVNSALVASCPSTIGADWLSDDEKAKYAFRDGAGPGSVVGLVLQEHGTTYPRDTTKGWNTPEEASSRKRRANRQ